MCGIAGVFNFKTINPVTHDILKTMSNEIKHRGPDDEGFYIKNNVGFAFRRLSIIDLNTGNQPIHNEDNTIWVIFNGEIYNYVELRKELKGQGHAFYTKSDTEVIVHLYEQYGENFPDYLNGMYAIALWDENKRLLFLVRDRAGIKPLYYSETKDGLLFASEIKAILSVSASKEMDFEAVNQYLAYGYIPSPLTGFKYIRKLNAGHILKCHTTGYEEREFWDLGISSNDGKLNENEIVNVLIDKLERVIKRQTRSDVPLGIFLSGGIDSSLIASIIVEKCNLKLDAFTIGFEDESYNELNNAQLITNKLGIPLHEFILSEKDVINEIDRIMLFFDEPLFDYSAIPVYFISKLARSKVKTVIGGEGGDELFGGYQTYYLHKLSRWYKKIPQNIRRKVKFIVDKLPESHRYLSTPYKLTRFTYGVEFPYDEAHYRWKVIFDSTAKKNLLTSDFLYKFSDLEAFHIMERYFNRAKSKGFDIEGQLMYVDFKTFLQDDPLQKTDRMSMANSLEVRVPLLDNDIIELSEGILPKIKGFQTKYILRKALSRFQPKEIAFGKKRGFTPPLAVWIKGGLKDYVLSILSRETINQTGLLKYNYITELVNDHLKGKAENSRQIWSLVVLVNWYLNYVSKR
ncbi:MAG: asparagine synthase (glutamine-hydrolyzing) [Candidatus Nitrosotenuis sp.]